MPDIPNPFQGITDWFGNIGKSIDETFTIIKWVVVALVIIFIIYLVFKFRAIIPVL